MTCRKYISVLHLYLIVNTLLIPNIASFSFSVSKEIYKKSEEMLWFINIIKGSYNATIRGENNFYADIELKKLFICKRDIFDLF